MSQRPHDIAFFGASLVSAHWNEAAGYHRGLLHALEGRGHRLTFYEPDALDRQRFRDLDDPPWARVVVYPGADDDGPLPALAEAREASVIIKASDIGVFDALLESAILEQRRPGQTIVFWDVDPVATLAHLQDHPADPLRELLPRFDRVLTYGGGEPVVRAYRELGVDRCAPIDDAFDPEARAEATADPRFSAHLSLLANRLPDRPARVEAFFFAAARALPDRRFLLGGSGWEDRPLPPNVRWLGHIGAAEHGAFHGGAQAVLGLSHGGSARAGDAPVTRVLEAAGAGACVITDAWPGVDRFLEPGREILVARDGAQVAAHLATLSAERARTLGEAARRRVTTEHTYALRAAQLEALLDGGPFEAPA